MKIIKRIYLAIKRTTKKLLVLLELFLFLRLMLKFLKANPASPIVNFVYKYSNNLIKPFSLIFSDAYWNDRIIETTTISAMVGYTILIFVFFYLLDIFFKSKKTF